MGTILTSSFGIDNILISYVLQDKKPILKKFYVQMKFFTSFLAKKYDGYTDPVSTLSNRG